MDNSTHLGVDVHKDTIASVILPARRRISVRPGAGSQLVQDLLFDLCPADERRAIR
jgi:hypothetical protein